MKLPNRASAIIDPAKIVEYLLNIEHVHGGPKARLLVSLGYTSDNWQQLEQDLRAMHLDEEVIATRHTLWGERFEIAAPITGPNGDTIILRSIWQIDIGTDRPRLITMYPE